MQFCCQDFIEESLVNALTTSFASCKIRVTSINPQLVVGWLNITSLLTISDSYMLPIVYLA